MTTTIGKLVRVDVRELWRHEGRGFTAWLEHNLDVLGDRLGLQLTAVQREHAVGPFNLDLLAEDDDHNPVIIENQLERTDHDHLGKVLTYLVNLDAKVAIWVTPDPRPEHERVVDWLNETTPAAFYLVKLEAYKIGDSDPAPLFHVVAGPDDQTRQVGVEKKEWAERHVLRHKFWAQLIETAKARRAMHATRQPTKDHWLGAGAGRSGVVFNLMVWKDAAGFELSIHTGNPAENKRIFDHLHAQKDAIEREFGHPLDWKRLDDKDTCRIVHESVPKGIREDPSAWPAIHERMIEDVERFAKVVKPLILAYDKKHPEGN